MAHRIHHPRDLVADGARRLGSVGIESLAREQIGEVDARRVDADPHRARLDVRVRRLPHFQDLGGPVARDDELSHARSARIASALSGHASVNSTDRWTAGSTSVRRTLRKPKRRKNTLAVSVRRYTVCTPWARARSRAAFVSCAPRPRPRELGSTATERSRAALP